MNWPRPVRHLIVVVAFAPFAPNTASANSLKTLPLQKVVYLACNLLTLGVGLWKCRSMGLLPTGTGDWLAFESRGVVSDVLFRSWSLLLTFFRRLRNTRYCRLMQYHLPWHTSYLCYEYRQPPRTPTRPRQSTTDHRTPFTTPYTQSLIPWYRGNWWHPFQVMSEIQSCDDEQIAYSAVRRIKAKRPEVKSGWFILFGFPSASSPPLVHPMTAEMTAEMTIFSSGSSI